MATQNNPDPTNAAPAAGQPATAPPTQEVTLRLDEGSLKSSYANFLRTHATADEVVIDFGLSLAVPPPRQGGQPELRVQVSDRIVMNYFLAKRLALTLGEILRRQEDQYGNIELDPNKRRKTSG